MPSFGSPKAPAPGTAIVAHLYRTADWWSDDGVTHRLEDMETSHLWAVAGYLRWYAPALATLVAEARPKAPQPTALDTFGISTWLENLPIWTAIAAALVKRGALVRADLLLETARIDGPIAPWEYRAPKRR